MFDTPHDTVYILLSVVTGQFPKSLELGWLGPHTGTGGPDVAVMASNHRLLHHLQ